MHKFTKESNGYTLTIEVDDKKLKQKLDLDIAEMEQIKKEHGNDIDAINEEIKWEYGMNKVNCDYEHDFCSPDEIIADRNEFYETIQKLIADNGETLWAMAQFKKNGTFKKNCKPTIKEAINGSYWEDSYGWNTLVMRLVPVTDILARVELDTVVIHW